MGEGMKIQWTVMVCMALSVVFGCESGTPATDPTEPLSIDAAPSADIGAIDAHIPDAAVESDCLPRDEAPKMPATASAYAALCSEYLGQMPTADCAQGVRIPVTVNGVEVFESPPDNVCDHTGFKGECSPGSTLRRQSGTNLDGTPRPEVMWITFCRATGADPARGLGSVQMIGHDIESGATCFFESPDAVGSQAQTEWVGLDENGRLSGALPGPGDPDFDRAWVPPPGPCSTCHHNDPFIHNPWIDGARLPEDPAKPVLPEIATADSPYWVVGGPQWDLRTPHIEGNNCTTCHRVGMGTIDIFDSLNVLDVNDTMPPYNPGSEADALEALRRCWMQGVENTPDCEWKNPPGLYCGQPDGKAGNADDDGAGDFQGSPCGDEFDPTEPCTGDPISTACMVGEEWWWCEDGMWTNDK